MVQPPATPAAKPRSRRFFGAASPPPVPTADGPVDLVEHSMALSKYLKDIDTRAGIEPDLYDSRIYVAMRRPRKADRTLVEGRSEQGGRVGVVELELDAEAEAVDLALIVVAHELHQATCARACQRTTRRRVRRVTAALKMTRI